MELQNTNLKTFWKDKFMKCTNVPIYNLIKFNHVQDMWTNRYF